MSDDSHGVFWFGVALVAIASGVIWGLIRIVSKFPLQSSGVVFAIAVVLFLVLKSSDSGENVGWWIVDVVLFILAIAGGIIWWGIPTISEFPLLSSCVVFAIAIVLFQILKCSDSENVGWWIADVVLFILAIVCGLISEEPGLFLASVFGEVVVAVAIAFAIASYSVNADSASVIKSMDELAGKLDNLEKSMRVSENCFADFQAELDSVSSDLKSIGDKSNGLIKKS